MKKEKFIEQLEYLLQDIPEEEKRDAIDYYRDYLEEAGPENEEEVLGEFGSPERIASIIRTDLLGVMGDGGEFTENGYGDRRFENVSLPAKYSGSANPYSKGSYAKRREAERKKKESRWPKFLLIVLAVLIASPFIFGISMGALGGTMGIIGFIIALLFVAATLTVAAFIGGAALFICGLTQLAGDLWLGLLSVGLGVAFTGAGCLLLVCSFLFYGKFIPWAVKGIIKIGHNIFDRNSKTNSERDNGASE